MVVWCGVVVNYATAHAKLACGAEVACEAHNLEDPGSKPGMPLILLFFRTVMVVVVVVVVVAAVLGVALW